MNKIKLLIVAAFALAMLALPGSALAKDRNHDRIPDKWEKKHHLSTTHNVAKKDPDKDGLSNRKEFKSGTNPRDADTDNDGMNDGNEVEVGDNPTDSDTNDDGVEDGNEVAGTIQHFDSTTGVLTILEADGTTTTSGSVTDATRIECENADANDTGDDTPGVHAARHGSDDGANHDAGDDNGGANEAGDDNGGTDNSGPGSSNSGPGSSDHGDENGQDDRADCTTADLTDGRVVHEAKLGTDANGQPTFTKVELDQK
jgi:hypothetical protein